MKKWTIWLALALCLAFVVPCAAEGVSFTPGEISSQLFFDALMSGKMIGGELSIDLDLDEDMLTSDDEEKAVIKLIEEALDDAVLSGAFGLTGDALRLELGAAYGGEGDTPATISAAADVTLDGVSVESDLIPGERITARWETLLTLAGLSEEEVAMFTLLKNADYATLLSEAVDAIAPMLEAVAEYAAPYGETVMAFAASLPVDVQENLPADEVYPAAAVRYAVSITEQDLGRLITMLADQLEADENLSPLVEVFLTQLDQNPQSAITTTAELCAQLRALASQMTDDTPVVGVIALDEYGTPVYVETYDVVEDDSGYYACLFCTPGETENAVDIYAEFSTYAAGAQPVMTIAFETLVAVDPEDINCTDASFFMVVAEEEEPLMQMEMYVDTTPTQSGLPGYEVAVSMNMHVDADGEVLSSSMTGSGINQLTAEGGEYVYAVSQMDMTIEDVTVSQYAEEAMTINPTADGFAGTLVETQKMPASGINEMTVTTSFSSWTHTPAGLTELALENATNDDMARLETAVMGNGIAKLGQLLALLPPELAQMLME